MKKYTVDPIVFTKWYLKLILKTAGAAIGIALISAGTLILLASTYREPPMHNKATVQAYENFKRQERLEQYENSYKKSTTYANK